MTQHSYRTARPLTAAVIAATLATGWLTAAAPASAATTGTAASVTATGTGGPLACASPPAPGMTACQLAMAPRTGPVDGVQAGAAQSAAAKSRAAQSGTAQSGAAQPAQAAGPVGYSPAQLQQAY